MYHGKAAHEIIGSTITINGDVGINYKYVDKHDVVYLDPEFSTTAAKNGMQGHEYYNAIKFWTKIAYNKANKVVICVNYADGIWYNHKKLTSLGMHLTTKITIPRVDRGNTLLYPDIIVNIYNKVKSDYTELLWNKCKHRAGKNGVNQAQPEWEINKIFHHIDLINNYNSVFDMFGGSGNVPNFCKTFNIKCTCTEIDQNSYTNILSRLKQNNTGCKVATCSNPVACKNLCKTHYAKATKEHFIGLDIKGNPIIGFNTISKQELSILGHETIVGARNESNSANDNVDRGRIHRRASDSTEETKEISI